MKTKTISEQGQRKIVTFVLLAFIMIANDSFAGWSTTTRSSCHWYAKRYVANSHSYDYSTGEFFNDHNGDCNCAVANLIGQNANPSYNWPCAYAYAQNGSGSCNNRGFSGTNAWYCASGAEYPTTPARPMVPPTKISPDSVGKSECQFSQNVSYEGDRYGLIRIDNISGFLSASTNTQFGAWYRIVLWVPQDISTGKGYEDTLITPQKVLWEGSIRIENGQIITTGGFSARDFDTTTTADSVLVSTTGQKQLFQVRRANGRAPYALDIASILASLRVNNPNNVPIDVINNVTLNDIAVTVEGGSGFGAFNDDLSAEGARKMNNSAPLANNSTTNIAQANNTTNRTIIYPNPFSNETNISFVVQNAGLVTLSVLNTNGQLVQEVNYVVTDANAINTVTINRGSLPQGVYMLKFSDAIRSTYQKLIVTD
jgi:hypothetical protein